MSLPRWRGLLLISGLIGFARGRKIGQLGNPPRGPSVVRVGPFHLSGQKKRRYDEGDAVARKKERARRVSFCSSTLTIALRATLVARNRIRRHVIGTRNLEARSVVSATAIPRSLAHPSNPFLLHSLSRSSRPRYGN